VELRNCKIIDLELLFDPSYKLKYLEESKTCSLLEHSVELLYMMYVP